MGEKKEGSESTKEWAYCLMRGPHSGGRSIPLFNDTYYTRTSLYHTWPQHWVPVIFILNTKLFAYC
jgi:hypothetical protein